MAKAEKKSCCQILERDASYALRAVVSTGVSENWLEKNLNSSALAEHATL